jgi:DNA-binding transcriptional MerR regulator
MKPLEDRRYGISEVSELVGVSQPRLRRWEKRYDLLRPQRTRTGLRSYTPKDIEIVVRIKQLADEEKMAPEGIETRLAEELYGEGRPKTNREIVDLLDKIESEVRSMLDILGRP